MRPHPATEPDRAVRESLDRAVVLDPGLDNVIARVGYPEPRIIPPGFDALAQIINAQQLSTRAAAAIWDSLQRHCRGRVTARKIRHRDHEALLACGLSRQKAQYLKELAEAVCRGDLDLDALATLDDGELVDRLTAHRGIGRWSAEIYAMFSLGRPDFYPVGDLALRVAIQRYRGLEERPDEKAAREFSLRWSPHRSAVALLMWKFYGATTLD